MYRPSRPVAPSGKSAERNLLSPEQVESNLANQSAQIRRVLDCGSNVNPARIMNNADWLGKFSFLEFLRDVGKHFSVPNMLAKYRTTTAALELARR